MSEVEAARREGERLGAARYLRDIVGTKLQAASGRTAEQLAEVVASLNPESFTDDAGDIDGDKVRAFASTMAPPPTAPATARTSSSLAEKRRQTAMRLSPALRDESYVDPRPLRGRK